MAGKSTKGAEIGARIAQARLESGGMNQTELGELVGVTIRSVQAWESGDVIPYRYLRALESALGKPAAWFLHGDEAVVGMDEVLREIIQRLDRLQASVDAVANRLPR